MEGKILLFNYNFIGFVSSDFFDEISDIEESINNLSNDNGKTSEKPQILDARIYRQESE